jgi:hypothetical protein
MKDCLIEFPVVGVNECEDENGEAIVEMKIERNIFKTSKIDMICSHKYNSDFACIEQGDLIYSIALNARDVKKVFEIVTGERVIIAEDILINEQIK